MRERGGIWQDPPSGDDAVDNSLPGYASAESGQARFTSTGTTGVAPSGLMAYHDYESGDRRLSFENFGSGWEAARGEVLHHTDYRIYPTTTRGM